jgi:hypothetical protein
MIEGISKDQFDCGAVELLSTGSWHFDVAGCLGQVAELLVGRDLAHKDGPVGVIGAEVPIVVTLRT